MFCRSKMSRIRTIYDEKNRQNLMQFKNINRRSLPNRPDTVQTISSNPYNINHLSYLRLYNRCVPKQGVDFKRVSVPVQCSLTKQRRYSVEAAVTGESNPEPSARRTAVYTRRRIYRTIGETLDQFRDLPGYSFIRIHPPRLENNRVVPDTHLARYPVNNFAGYRIFGHISDRISG